VDSRSGARARAQVSESGNSGLPDRPASLLVAAIVQAAEAAGVLAASVLAGVDAGAGRSYHADSGVALTVIGLATGAALAYVASGLARARRWSRTPALLTQLFTGIVAIYLIQGHRYDWGVPGVALAVAGFAALVVPPSLRALAGGPSAPGAGSPGRAGPDGS
jgi:peptidoglycan/LPS O-acetylase OafA/YrhL